jgi:hypothetical protein
MDSTTLAAGLTTILSDFATDYGTIVLSVLGIAVGLYGAKLIFAAVTNFIRVRRASK